MFRLDASPAPTVRTSRLEFTLKSLTAVNVEAQCKNVFYVFIHGTFYVKKTFFSFFTFFYF